MCNGALVLAQVLRRSYCKTTERSYWMSLKQWSIFEERCLQIANVLASMQQSALLRWDGGMTSNSSAWNRHSMETQTHKGHNMRFLLLSRFLLLVQRMPGWAVTWMWKASTVFMIFMWAAKGAPFMTLQYLLVVFTMSRKTMCYYAKSLITWMCM